MGIIDHLFVFIQRPFHKTRVRENGSWGLQYCPRIGILLQELLGPADQALRQLEAQDGRIEPIEIGPLALDLVDDCIEQLILPALLVTEYELLRSLVEYELSLQSLHVNSLSAAFRTRSPGPVSGGEVERGLNEMPQRFYRPMGRAALQNMDVDMGRGESL